ncbi:MAG: dihydroorotase [Candidatus Omnitrophota bacterium]|jgi:dihydroorotase
MAILIKNGRVVDPANKIDDIQDILIEQSKIARVSKGIKTQAGEIIDAAGRLVMPGIVDMHVHLREPGREDKETILTGTSAALRGGVTSCLAMPNTQPAIDCPGNVRLVKDIITKTAKANVFIAGAITKGRQGQEITDINSLKNEGVLAITDDGSSVDCDELLLEVFKIAKANKVLVICHSEDTLLTRGGVVNLGLISTCMGLRGIAKESEYKRVQRDIQLAKRASAPVHIAHISCSESVEIIAEAKREGIEVTAETAPHYFSLTEEQALGYDTNMKINPPLRSKGDVAAIRQGLQDGTIDVIASDHAPHTENEKDIEFEHAAFGTTGLETELSVGITELVQTDILGWTDLVSKLTTNPARILGLDKGDLSIGKDADIIIIDPTQEWVVSKDNFLSKSKNCAFLGSKLNGVVEYTICNGKIAYKK